MKTLVACYVIGIVPLLLGVYYLAWNTSLALWNDPNLANCGPPETWPPPYRSQNEILVFPHQTLGLYILILGLAVFYLSPTVAWQVAREG